MDYMVGGGVEGEAANLIAALRSRLTETELAYYEKVREAHELYTRLELIMGERDAAESALAEARNERREALGQVIFERNERNRLLDRFRNPDRAISEIIARAYNDPGFHAYDLCLALAKHLAATEDDPGRPVPPHGSGP